MAATGIQQATLNIERTCLSLRGDLVFSPQVHRGEIYYQLESPQAKYYRLSYAGYVFVSLLDGQTTFSEALAISAQQLGSKALASHEALEIYHWLLEKKLGSLQQDAGSAQMLGDGESLSGTKSPPNPFWIRVPLGNPDKLVKTLLPVFGFLFSPLASGIGLLLITAAAAAVWSDWESFGSASTNLFSPRNWLWMTVAWVMLKVVHELAHAICCRRYGGKVRETGIVFVLLAPLAYVDVSSSWNFPSKWWRMHVAAAGIYAELLLASLAVFAWQHTESKFVSHMLVNIIFMASASTVLFNANPLMRFDGYFILADLLEIPNLYGEAGKAVRAHLNRLLFGGVSQVSEKSRQAVFIACYGWAAAAWRIVVFASLSIAASVLFHGAGLALAIAAVGLWGFKSLMLIRTTIADRWSVDRMQVLRAAGVLVSLAGVASLVLFRVPSPVTVSAPGVIENVDEHNLRSLTGGFVDEVHVTDGQAVEADQVLVTLRNFEVANEYQDAQLAIEQMQIRYQTARETHDTPAVIVAKREIGALEDRLAEATKRFAALEIRAPSAGNVTRRSIKQLVGTFVDEGETLLTVVSNSRKELSLSLGQDHFEAAVPKIGFPVAIRVGSMPRLAGVLERLEPRASTQLSHPALAATHDGPLDVVGSESERGETAELAEPRFRAVVAMTSSHDAEIFSGQVATAYLGFRNETIGQSIYRCVHDWLSDKLAAASAR